MASASERWAHDLRSWAIPDAIAANAPEDPHALPVSLFRRAADDARDRDTPSRRAALDALEVGGTVLDVGCGAGAASLALIPRARRIEGLDESRAMLAAFEQACATAGVAARAIEGRWPDAADRVDAADLVVCHHVLYNVPDIDPFIDALTAHARRRVVVEITRSHPRAWMNALWKHIHGIDRPERPTAEDAVAVIRARGIDPEVTVWEAPGTPMPADELVPFVRRALCVSADRDGDVADALARLPRPATRELATIVWAGNAPAA